MDGDRDSAHPRTPAPHEGGTPRFLPLMVIAILVMFVVAGLIVFALRHEWAAPGSDKPAPASQVAPADK
ncbi:hypothetical protein WBP06_04025 [Novosphingobium sp. BL-8H]|uniref:hypothetical protein n=1 Tax=Novosphingobium sp. BL-8H TaxID=3127640 RepID=UPI003757DB2C